MTLKNLFFISCLLLLGFCLLTSAEVSEEDAAVVKQFVPEGCKVDEIKKADLDEDEKPELVFAYSGQRQSDEEIILKGLIILKWDGVNYMKQWEDKARYEQRTAPFEWLKVQDVTNDGKPEILLCWGCSVWTPPHGMYLVVFTWDGKTYKLLGANGAEEEFYSVGVPDVATGMVYVYKFIDSTTTYVLTTMLTYPNTYKWDGSKFVLLHNIREGKTFGSSKTEKPCKIDGKLDDWGLEGIPVYDEKAGPQLEDNDGGNQLWWLDTHVELGRDKHDVLFRPENWRGILDLGAWFDTRWDDKMPYIVVQVADDKLVQEWQGDSLYKGDHVEIWFDADLTGDFDVAKANSDDFQIGISPGNFKENKPEMYCWLPKTKEGNIKNAKVSAKRTNDGYILEATIPFQFLGIEPQPNKMLGFTLLVSDIDEKEKPQKCMIGTSPQYKWGNPTTWDNFVFLVNLVIAATSPLPMAAAGNVELVGAWPFGPSHTVAVDKGICYLGSGGGIYVLDMSNPVKPEKIAEYKTPGVVAGLAAQGGYLYVADGKSGLRVIDVSDPKAPKEVGFYKTQGSALDVFVVDRLAYVVDGDLRVIDVSDPKVPKQIGFYETQGSVDDVFVVDRLAYVADGDLRVIDVSDPKAPKQVGSYETKGANDVFVAGGIAYVADGLAGLQVIDISDPKSPKEVGFYEPPIYTGYIAKGVFVVGGMAFVAAGFENRLFDKSGELQVIDVSDPESPKLVASYETSGYAHDIFIVGGLAYVAAGEAGLQVIDVSDPKAPKQVGSYETSINSAEGVFVDGGLAYVVDRRAGLRVIDVSNPKSPKQVGSYKTKYYANDVFVSGELAYVVEGEFGEGRGGLRVIDVSDPKAPKLVGAYETKEFARGVFVAGGLAYVADDYEGCLRIIDVSDPKAPKQVGSYEKGAHDVFVVDRLAYVAADGLRVIDVSNPQAPKEVGFYKTQGSAYDVFVADRLAYVADGDLRVIDVSDPKAPKEVGSYETPGDANGVFVAGELVYVADGEAGLQILRFLR